MVFGGKKQEQTAGDNSIQTQIETQNNYNINIIQYREDIDINEQQKKSQVSIPKQEDVKPIIPHFSLSVPDGLLHRDNEEEELYGLISRNRIINLVGAGGSGKSSLANLCLVKHKNDFNEIAYVVVNNNIKDDFVEQINKTLKLDIKKDPVGENDNALKLENKGDFVEQINKTSKQKIRDDVYSIIISYLQENYKAEKQNLLVLDINETSDKNKNAEIIEGIIKNNIFLDSWKFLILSREKVDTRRRIKSYNLDDIEDTEFLKELFLEKVGNRYNDFDDFQELFKAIYYNPLLTEQLGYYLKRQPKVLTINEITSIFNRDSFKEMEMNGLSAQRHDERIISFLKKIIIFDNLEKNEKELLRHFVLWPSDYIVYDVIKGLLQNVFESEDQLVATLASLSERSILTTNDEQTLSYKLHGLLAESLRGQIDINNEDYEEYLGNIEDIIEYSYYEFVPYVECIGNSLCEYDITEDYDLINNVGVKLIKSWKFDYCEIVLGKSIRIREKLPKDNPEFQNGLASTYNNLAILQSDQLEDYESAERNYNKAIEIREKLPKDNPEFQNDLARAYINLASFQSDQLEDYESAERNYNKAIKIIEKLPKDNPQFQYDLARAYKGLAILKSDHLGGYESAESNYNKAIKIIEKLPKDNPEFLIDLSTAYNNLANLQSEHLEDYESAERNYNKAIKIIEKLPKDNPEFLNYLATAYNHHANLQSDHIGDYISAERNYNKAIEISEKLPDNPQFQNGLASTYNNLAYCYFYQKQYLEAIEQVNKAIDIAYYLSQKDSKYLIEWIGYKHSLAEFVFNKGEVEKAKGILEEIKPLAEKCLSEKTDDSWTQTVNNNINELLAKCSNL